MMKFRIQVQPQWSEWNEWMALSVREGLFFEPLEFSLRLSGGDEEELCAMREQYRMSGRTTSLHGVFIDVNPASSDPAFSALSRRRCHESCSLARELGAEEVVFHASAHPFLRGPYLENWAAKCADFYEELAGTYRLGVRIENSQDVDCTPLMLLMKRVKSSDVAVCLDVGHAHYSRVPVEKWFDQLGESIRYLHLSDNMGQFDDHLPIGSGSIDWARVSSLAEQLDGRVSATLEVGGIKGVEKSVDFLRRHGYFGLEERA